MKIVLISMLCGGLLVVLGVGGTYWSYGMNLQHYGIPTKANVVDMWGGKGRRHISYEYSVGGVVYRVSDGLGTGKFKDFDGSQISIRYLPEKPSVSHFDPVRLETRGRYIVSIVTLSALTYSLCWLGFVRKYRNG